MWNLLQQTAQMLSTGESVCLVTLVDKHGSTYRRPGAKMLISDQGMMSGSISGGCLEDDVSYHAREVLKSGQPKTIHYELDDDTILGLGVGCGGSISLLLDVVQEKWLKAFLENKMMTVTAQIVESSSEKLTLGMKCMLRKDQIIWSDNMQADVAEKMHQAMREAVNKQSSLLKEFETEQETYKVYVDLMHPPRKLIVFGAGDDAIPVAAFALGAGFEVEVIDQRPIHLIQSRFPGCRLTKWQGSSTVERLDLNKRTSVIVMSHHLERDAHALQAFLPTEVGYIGVLGPKHRFDRIVTQFTELDEQEVAEDHRLFTPVGLDIGADTPEEIALSIISEIIAIDNQFEGGFLRLKSGGIHSS